MKCLVHFPKSRLAELASEFGGVSRAEAITNAQAGLEIMRGEADHAIGEKLTALEAIAAAPHDPHGYSPAQLAELLARGDQIVTLASTFGHDALDTAARCLCDLAAGLGRAGIADVASVKVHVRTMRLLAPGATLAKDHQDRVLSELARILDFHGFSRSAITVAEP